MIKIIETEKNKFNVKLRIQQLKLKGNNNDIY